ncbi:MAG: hydrogenase small subunit [Deferrisomatales bacterium]
MGGTEATPGGVTRRGFLNTCITATAVMGLPFGMHRTIAQAALAPDRPPVIWLHFQECTGCSETLLRSSHPELGTFLLDLVSLDYHETLMAGSGLQAERALRETLEANRGRYLLVAEGAIPTKDGGIYCKVGGKTAMEAVTEAAEGAAAILAIGSCASFGGIQSVAPNPTGAVGVGELVGDKPLVRVPGCPPNPYNFLSTVLYYLAFSKLPELDDKGRPLFAYGRRIHEHCERRPHFDAGRFARAFGDEGHRQGHCLYQLGCKGPATFSNCSVTRFNDADTWPVGVGHPCIGCTEPDLPFHTSIFDHVPIHHPTPPDTYPPVSVEARGSGADPMAAAAVGLVAGAALGAGAMLAKKLPKEDPGEDDR